MRIIEVNPEAIDLIEAKILDDFSEVKILVVEVNTLKILTKANIRGNNYQGNNYQGNRGLYHNPHRNYQQGNNYGQFRGRSCGSGRGNCCGHSQGRSNYQDNNNYQYHQYYGHDDEYQSNQYGPPCALCSGYNHSPKHDINDIMKKKNISGHQSQLSGLYS